LTERQIFGAYPYFKTLIFHHHNSREAHAIFSHPIGPLGWMSALFADIAIGCSGQ
jgi:hypothetical protein